jgi:cytochrome P450
VPHFDAQLTSSAFLHSPYPVYHRLREEAPVYWSETWGAWLLTRYDDVVATLRDHRRFTSLGRLTMTMKPALEEPLWERIQPLVAHYSKGLINVDPPDHTRLRSLVHQAFTPRRIAGLQGYVQAIVDTLLDRFQRGSHMDLVGDLAYPLPVTVIAELMGVPAQDHHKIKAWSSDIVRFMATARPDAKVLLLSQEALLALRDYFRWVVSTCRREPRDDLISGLVTAEEEGEKLTEEELLSTLVTILIGGHETTTSLIASGTLLLLTHPDERRRLEADPTLYPSAVEEFLRYEGPFQRNRRIATEDVEIGEQKIGKGELVMQLLGAANRDPDQFEDPDRLDLSRQPNRHVAFGYGVHFCLGAALARLEAPVALRTLFRRLPGLELAVEPGALEWENTVFRGLKALPVRC